MQNFPKASGVQMGFGGLDVSELHMPKLCNVEAHDSHKKQSVMSERLLPSGHKTSVLVASALDPCQLCEYSFLSPNDYIHRMSGCEVFMMIIIVT